VNGDLDLHITLADSASVMELDGNTKTYSRNFDKRDSLEREKAYKREVSSAF
jgi:hypothetical protein